MTKTTKLRGLNLNKVNRYLELMRECITKECKLESPFFEARRTRGKRGRRAGGKTIVFGLLKRNGKVFTKVVPNCSRATLYEAIGVKVDFESKIHSDGWKGYNGLVDLGYKKYYRVQQGNDEFANSKLHIDGIESFWGNR